MIEQIWGGRIVSDSAISTRINAARKALDDDGTQQRVIKTVHGRGFRFAADTEKLADDDQKVASGPNPIMEPGTVLSDPGRPSIIMMPFENLTGDSDQDFLADGLRIDIQNALVKVSGVFLIAIASAIKYRGIPTKQAADEMGVQYSLAGSVRRSANKVRFSVTLTDELSGETIWAEQYDRELTDAFEMLDEITGQVLTAMNVKLVAGEPARVWHKTLKDLRSLEALYRGIDDFFKMDADSMREARRFFGQVAKWHPEASIGPTWVGITHWIDFQRGWSDDREVSKNLALEWAKKAIALPDSDGQAYTVLCHLHLIDKDFEAALALGKEAIANRPNCTNANAHYANVLHYCGDQEAALHHIRLAMRFAPIHPPQFKDILATIYRAVGDFDQAAETAKAAIVANPTDLIARLILASISIHQNDPDSGTLMAQEIHDLEPSFSTASFAEGQPYRDAKFLKKYIAELRNAGLPE